MNKLFALLWLIQTVGLVTWLWILHGSVIAHRKMIAKLMFKTGCDADLSTYTYKTIYVDVNGNEMNQND